MTRVAIRLLLALCLVLNGIGSAMAAAAMPALAGGSQHAVVPTAEAQPSAGACDHGADAKSPAGEPPAASATVTTAACNQDCCAQGVCDCPCMQFAHAALLDIPGLSADPGPIRMTGEVPVGHATPALLNLIRPPIG